MAADMSLHAAGAARRGGNVPRRRREPLLLPDRPVGDLLERERRSAFLRLGPLTPDIEFLVRRGIPPALLSMASRLATLHGTEPRQELLALGFDRRFYWQALAEDLRLPFVADLDGAVIVPTRSAMELLPFASVLRVRIDGVATIVAAPGRNEIPLLRRRLHALPALARHIRIAAPETIRDHQVALRRPLLLDHAVNRLWRRLPRLSARHLRARPARTCPPAAAALALALLAPAFALALCSFACTFFFFNCSFWKLVAAFARPSTLRLQPLPSGRLPSYAVLVPLYREAAIIPDLLRHLGRLDYPASRLQVLVLLEEDDLASRQAVARHGGMPFLEVVLVPPGGPRTKPNALTYALPFVRGDCVVVYDAEDRPEPDQLRKAAAAFQAYPQLGCVQARLQPDNGGSWLARMFAVEYAANFEILLPALAARDLPLPLGGTSNHFPRAVLEAVGGWDPFNVTEDADLGIRLARFGYPAATIASRTFEEAPVTFRQWLPQRRRWIKGWLQTAMVCRPGHIPARLRLPLRQELAVHGIISGGVLGLLLFPASVPVVLLGAMMAVAGRLPETPWLWTLFVFNALNVAAVVTAAAVSALRGLRAAGMARHAWLVPLLPLYWALMSVAAWQALFQLRRDPSGWEKTLHGVAVDRRQSPAPLSF